MNELLPCPFCGGEAKVCRGVYGSWFVRCANDYKDMANPGCSVSPTTTAKDTEAEAIEAWNSRAERTCKVRTVERIGDMFGIMLSCGHSMVNPFKDIPDYCPWCGAKVVGE